VATFDFANRPAPKGFICAAGCGHGISAHREAGCDVRVGAAEVCGCSAPYGRIPPGDPNPAPAESDMQADLDILRGLLTGYLRDDDLGVHARQVGFEALQRIEQWAGER